VGTLQSEGKRADGAMPLERGRKNRAKLRRSDMGAGKHGDGRRPGEKKEKKVPLGEKRSVV